MQYDGFISAVIRRSEDILQPHQNDEFAVTRLLLLLNTAFALVYERIYRYDNSPDLRFRRVPSSENLDEVRVCKVESEGGDENFMSLYFDTFVRGADWMFCEITDSRRNVSVHDIERFLGAGRLIDRSDLVWGRILPALRNSFAHGGIFPMSPEQANFRGLTGTGRTPFIKPNEIDRVYFLSGTSKNCPGWAAGIECRGHFAAGV